MLTVLTVPISATTPRPTSTVTPLESPRRDEYGATARALHYVGDTNHTTNKLSPADSRQQNNHCPAPRPLWTPHTVRRLHRRDPHTIHSSNPRRKPGGDGKPSLPPADSRMQTATVSHTVHSQRSEDSLGGGKDSTIRSPQEPRTQTAASDQHGPARPPTRQSPSMLGRRCPKKERPSVKKEDGPPELKERPDSRCTQSAACSSIHTC